MKPSLLWVSVLFAAATVLPAQEPTPDQSPPLFTPEELEQLLGPIALYPDALIALILPAATEPSDLVLAARYLQAQGEAAQIDYQPWDDSVKALARYPTVVTWMDQNLAWTQQLGDAFASQPADVMNAIQRLRTQAQAAGALTDTPQQQIIVDDADIRIVPAQADVIYVPYYDPAVVYVNRRVYYPRPFLTFSVGFPAGYWLAYDCDWGRRTIWVVNRPARHRVWHERSGFRQPVFATPTCRVEPSTLHAWRPPSSRRSHSTYPNHRDYDRPRRSVSRYTTVEENAPSLPHPSITRRENVSRRAVPAERPRSTTWSGHAPAPEQADVPAVSPPSSRAPNVINGRRVLNADDRIRRAREHNEQSAAERRASFPHRNAPVAAPMNRQSPGIATPPPAMQQHREITRTPPASTPAEQRVLRSPPRAAPSQPKATRTTAEQDGESKKSKQRHRD